MEHFYNMKHRFWAVGCGLGWAVGKKVWADYEQLLIGFLNFLLEKKKHCSVRTEKLHKEKVKKNLGVGKKNYFRKISFFRAKNATVST